MFRIPSRVLLPFGYLVTIKHLTDTEMQDIADGDLDDGLWDVETKTIYIRKGLSVRRQRYILTHELHHALIDWTHECLNDEIAKA